MRYGQQRHHPRADLVIGDGRQGGQLREGGLQRGQRVSRRARQQVATQLHQALRTHNGCCNDAVQCNGGYNDVASILWQCGLRHLRFSLPS